MAEDNDNNTIKPFLKEKLESDAAQEIDKFSKQYIDPVLSKLDQHVEDILHQERVHVLDEEILHQAVTKVAEIKNDIISLMSLMTSYLNEVASIKVEATSGSAELIDLVSKINNSFEMHEKHRLALTEMILSEKQSLIETKDRLEKEYQDRISKIEDRFEYQMTQIQKETEDQIRELESNLLLNKIISWVGVSLSAVGGVLLFVNVKERNNERKREQ